MLLKNITRLIQQMHFKGDIFTVIGILQFATKQKRPP